MSTFKFNHYDHYLEVFRFFQQVDVPEPDLSYITLLRKMYGGAFLYASAGRSYGIEFDTEEGQTNFEVDYAIWTLTKN